MELELGPALDENPNVQRRGTDGIGALSPEKPSRKLAIQHGSHGEGCQALLHIGTERAEHLFSEESVKRLGNLLDVALDLRKRDACQSDHCRPAVREGDQPRC